MFDPHTSRLIATENYRVLMDFDDEFEKLVDYKALKTGIGAREDWLSKNPQMVERIRAAYAETLNLAAEDRAFFNQFGGEYFGLKDGEAARHRLGAAGPPVRRPVGRWPFEIPDQAPGDGSLGGVS